MTEFLQPDEIKRRAKERGHDLGDLLRRIGMHPSTFSRWRIAGRVNKIEAYSRLLEEIDKPPLKKRPRSGWHKK